MRKNKLIELLSGMKGNPEIVVWNGHVEDWMSLKELKETSLVRQSKKKVLHFHNLQRLRDGLEVTEDISRIKPSDWVLDEKRFEDVEIYDQEKKVAIFIPETRHKSTFDRMGDMEY